MSPSRPAPDRRRARSSGRESRSSSASTSGIEPASGRSPKARTDRDSSSPSPPPSSSPAVEARAVEQTMPRACVRSAPYAPDRRRARSGRADRATRAPLVVDMQNDFVRAGAPLEVPDARRRFPPRAPPARGVPRPRPAGRLHALPLARRGQPALALVAAVPPRRSRLLARPQAALRRPRRSRSRAPRSSTSCRPHRASWSSTSSATAPSTAPTSTSRLRALGVRSLVVTGTVTQICVEETAREAFHHGYRTTVVCRCRLVVRPGSPRRDAEEPRDEVRLGRRRRTPCSGGSAA